MSRSFSSFLVVALTASASCTKVRIREKAVGEALSVTNRLEVKGGEIGTVTMGGCAIKLEV